MSVIINKSNENRYTIAHYSLKVIQADLPEDESLRKGITKHTLRNFDDPAPHPKEFKYSEPQEEEESPQNDQSELIESLLQKADDFSSKYLKAQMALEELQERHAKELARLKEESYAQGYEAAKVVSQKEAKELYEEKLELLGQGAKMLAEESQKFEGALHRIEEELIGAALDIAHEVIIKEVSKHANEVTAALAQSLMREVEKATQITLRVHPRTIEYLKKAVDENTRVHVVADKAVAEGGVVLVSNIGTIEGDILERYEQVKRIALQPKGEA
ncbi:MAG: hypothetical protein KU37_11105 [Sulfuricurvum sp. PC08-66]|nr:MAG: hypothetical protein KU37_11105 [Sulfuricurvum sp. PC08-66]